MKKQRGVGAVVVVLIVATLAVAGGIGYAVYSKSRAISLVADGVPTSQTQPYQRLTTVPAAWKAYTNTAYKYSLRHPASWKVIVNKGQLLGSGQPANKETHYISFNASGTNKEDDQIAVGFEVTHETIAEAKAAEDQTLDEERRLNTNDQYRTKKLSERPVTFDGHPALEIKEALPAEDGGAGSTVTWLYISANKLLYKVMIRSSDTGAEAKVENTILESLNIN